jgi:hypothetical protein
MALGRTYTVDSGVVSVATATQTALIVGYTGSATIVADIEAVRFSVIGATTFPSNASVLVGLYRTTGSSFTGTTVTPNPHNAADVAANSIWKIAAFVGLTITAGSQIWAQNVPFTAGSNWAEWVTPGAEWRIAPSATAGTGVALAITCSTAGTATSFQCELVFSE